MKLFIRHSTKLETFPLYRVDAKCMPHPYGLDSAVFFFFSLFLLLVQTVFLSPVYLNVPKTSGLFKCCLLKSIWSLCVRGLTNLMGDDERSPESCLFATLTCRVINLFQERSRLSTWWAFLNPLSLSCCELPLSHRKTYRPSLKCTVFFEVQYFFQSFLKDLLSALSLSFL